MAKFRKKPVTIEAIQWTGHESLIKYIQELNTLGRNIGYSPVEGTLDIETLEGTHTANPGDWIIQGVKGELYPCKPDIFKMTYEPVEEL